MISRRAQKVIKGIPVLGSLARRLRGGLVSRAPGLLLPTDTESARETRRHLGFAVEYVYQARVEGDVVELGTAAGISATALARAMVRAEQEIGPPRRLLLFDSFVGLPESTTEIDRSTPLVRDGSWAPGTCRVLSAGELRTAVLSGSGLDDTQLVIHEGWYADTVPAREVDTTFALIHVDCDLYQSTMDALDPMFGSGRVAEGAIVLFDDWNCNRASPRYGERRAWMELVGKHSIQSSDGGDYSWAGHKFIVHAYQARPYP
jgi:O-methyltransferase